jgi:hypothetical protein
MFVSRTLGTKNTRYTWIYIKCLCLDDRYLTNIRYTFMCTEYFFYIVMVTAVVHDDNDEGCVATLWRWWLPCATSRAMTVIVRAVRPMLWRRLLVITIVRCCNTHVMKILITFPNSWLGPNARLIKSQVENKIQIQIDGKLNQIRASKETSKFSIKLYLENIFKWH